MIAGFVIIYGDMALVANSMPRCNMCNVYSVLTFGGASLYSYQGLTSLPQMLTVNYR